MVLGVVEAGEEAAGSERWQQGARGQEKGGIARRIEEDQVTGTLARVELRRTGTRVGCGGQEG